MTFLFLEIMVPVYSMFIFTVSDFVSTKIDLLFNLLLCFWRRVRFFCTSLNYHFLCKTNASWSWCRWSINTFPLFPKCPFLYSFMHGKLVKFMNDKSQTFLQTWSLWISQCLYRLLAFRQMLLPERITCFLILSSHNLFNLHEKFPCTAIFTLKGSFQSLYEGYCEIMMSRETQWALRGKSWTMN